MCQDCCTADGLCFFSMRYGDGSGIAGGLHTDWISVGDGTLGAQYVFGGITTMSSSSSSRRRRAAAAVDDDVQQQQ